LADIITRRRLRRYNARYNGGVPRCGQPMYAPPAWCSVANHMGAAVLKVVPGDERTHVRYFPSNWDKYGAFQHTLRKLDAGAAWPPQAGRACREFLANLLCGLAVAWNVAALRPAPQPAAAHAACHGTGERLLIVCPLITYTHTKKHKAAGEAAAGCGGDASGRLNVPFSDLELGDFAFALAHKNARNAFTLRVAGKITPLVELLEIAALTTSSPRKARNPARLLVCTSR
jgi:hypothetical protein